MPSQKAPLHQSEEQRVLGRVSVVDAAEEHARRLRNLPQRRRGEALSPEEPGGGEQLLVLDSLDHRLAHMSKTSCQ